MCVCVCFQCLLWVWQRSILPLFILLNFEMVSINCTGKPWPHYCPSLASWLTGVIGMYHQAHFSYFFHQVKFHSLTPKKEANIEMGVISGIGFLLALVLMCLCASVAVVLLIKKNFDLQVNLQSTDYLLSTLWLHSLMISM